jgi:hypothetical protein
MARTPRLLASILLWAAIAVPSPARAQAAPGIEDAVGQGNVSDAPHEWRDLFWDIVAGGERGTLARYGFWYGPGWWGGSEDPNRVGNQPPVDSLDAVAQRHDFGYLIAEEVGKGRPEVEHFYKAMADLIAAQEALSLPMEPSQWSSPADDPIMARRYRDRIAQGFPQVVANLNACRARLLQPPADATDPETLNRLLDYLPSEEQFIALTTKYVRNWEAKYLGTGAMGDEIVGTWGRRNHPIPHVYLFSYGGRVDLQFSGESHSGTWHKLIGNSYIVHWTHGPPGQANFVDTLTFSTDKSLLLGTNNFGNEVTLYRAR